MSDMKITMHQHPNGEIACAHHVKRGDQVIWRFDQVNGAIEFPQDDSPFAPSQPGVYQVKHRKEIRGRIRQDAALNHPYFYKVTSAGASTTSGGGADPVIIVDKSH